MSASFRLETRLHWYATYTPVDVTRVDVDPRLILACRSEPLRMFGLAVVLHDPEAKLLEVLPTDRMERKVVSCSSDRRVQLRLRRRFIQVAGIGVIAATLSPRTEHVGLATRWT
jgi:hypothetical protein